MKRAEGGSELEISWINQKFIKAIKIQKPILFADSRAFVSGNDRMLFQIDD